MNEQITKIGLQRLAIAIIFRALKDLHHKKSRHRITAIIFLESDLYYNYAVIANINNPEKLYEKHKKIKLKKNIYFKKRKKYYIRKKEKVKS